MKTLNSNDEIRKKILEYLYNVYRNARSLKSSCIPIKKLKQDLKKLGLKEQEIARNLNYLVQTGWVREEKEKITFKTQKGFFREKEKACYKITDAGINRFEGPSEFQRLSKSFSGINITNIQGVTVIGDQNVVNTQYIELYKDLSLLSEAVRNSSQLSDKEKLEYTADIETIKDQLTKLSPNKDIIRRAWEGLKELANISDVADALKKVVKLIEVLLT